MMRSMRSSTTLVLILISRRRKFSFKRPRLPVFNLLILRSFPSRFIVIAKSRKPLPPRQSEFVLVRG